MSQHEETGEADLERGETNAQESLNATSEFKEARGATPIRAADVVSEAMAGNLTMEVLNRYLAVAAEDREAAEARSAQIIARFSKLTIAMMCVTMVIAGANLTMIARQSSAKALQATVSQSPAAAPSRPVEVPIVAQPPAASVLPAPAPPEPPREPPRPAEKTPLLGTPPSTRARLAIAAGSAQLARIAQPQHEPLLSVRNVDVEPREFGHAERW